MELLVHHREAALLQNQRQFRLRRRVNDMLAEMLLGNFDRNRRQFLVAQRLFDFGHAVFVRFDFGDQRVAFLRHIGGDFLRQFRRQIGDGCARLAVDHFAINPAGFRADDFGHDDGLFIRLEDAPGDENFGAGQIGRLWPRCRA